MWMYPNKESPQFCLLIKICKFHLVELSKHLFILIPSFKFAVMMDVPAAVAIPLAVRLFDN